MQGFSITVARSGSLAVPYCALIETTYRNRLEQVGSTQPLREEVGGDRAPLASQFRSLPDGTEFWVVVNHFNRGNEEVRNRQATNLRNWIESQFLPVAALGEYNMDYSVHLSFKQPGECNGNIEQGNEAFRIFTESNEFTPYIIVSQYMGI
jgi:hypothetical protein